MNKKDFVKMIEPFTTPEMQTIMGEGLEIIYPPNRGIKIKNKLLFVNNMHLVYSTDEEHYYFKFKKWHDMSSGSIPFNPNMRWGGGEPKQVEMLNLRPYPISRLNDGLGWLCEYYQIIPENYLLEYFGIGNRFMNWKTNPWEVKS